MARRKQKDTANSLSWYAECRVFWVKFPFAVWLKAESLYFRNLFGTLEPILTRAAFVAVGIVKVIHQPCDNQCFDVAIQGFQSDRNIFIQGLLHDSDRGFVSEHEVQGLCITFARIVVHGKVADAVGMIDLKCVGQ